MTGPLRINRFVLGPLSTNCYLVWEPGSGKGMLIDPAEHSDDAAKVIREEGIEVACVLNTHGHADHIAGDASYGYPVYIHELDAPCLSDPARNLSFMLEERIDQPAVGKLLRDGDVIDLGGAEFRVIHTPGHSPGGICALCGDVLFSGDTLFREGIGRTDIPGGDHEALVSSIREKLFVLPDEVKVYPGHGPETTIGHEKRFY